MIWHMIVRNVLHRPARTAISVIAVGVEVTLVLLVVGLTSGLLQETAKRIEGVGADLMLQPPSASVFMAFSGAPMPIRIREKLEELKHVQAVAPVLLQFNSSGGLDIVYGIEPESFRAVSGGFVIREGTDLEGPNDLLVDDWYAQAKNVKVGQNLRLFDNNFRVAGIVEHGKGARLFVNIKTLQELSGAREKASLFFVKCTRPEHTPNVSEEIRQLFPKHEIRPLKDFLSLMTSSNLPGLNAFIGGMITLAVAIGFLVIFLSMYTIITERTREIGVLKSLGASKGYIIKALLSETMLIVGVGIGVGIAMGFGARRLCADYFPTLTVLITPEWILRAALIAVLGGLLGAIYPAWLASKKDPVEALAYE
ncbi:MAG TPA: FtsX-like permease family protein [Candidatus Nitrosotenuis sp.]|nr:FtsX-like permease family protein [Candidatus Nitrosotenuis sp.]